jgi:hypothetical protein
MLSFDIAVYYTAILSQFSEYTKEVIKMTEGFTLKLAIHHNSQ